MNLLKKLFIFFAVFVFVLQGGLSAWAGHWPRKYFDERPSPPAAKDFDYWDVTGDWGGWRTKLDEKGFDMASTFVFDVLGNVNGGKARGTRYDHSLGLDINFDLEKMINLKGSQIHVSGLYRAGRNLSKDVIGNKLVVTSIFGHEEFRFYSLYVEQAFFDDILNVRIGRMGAADDFLNSKTYAIYVSNAIDGMPINIPINFPFPVYPSAAWGARSVLNLTNTVYLTSGIYDADPDVYRDDMYGMDFSLRLSRGILAMQEAAYAPNTEKGAKGLPGHYKAGGYVIGGTFPELYSDSDGEPFEISGEGPRKHTVNYGGYLHADHMLYREGGPGTDQGLIAFAVVTVGPPDINLLPVELNFGTYYTGLIPGRDKDVTAFGFAYVGWSLDDTRTSQILREKDPDIDPGKYEYMLEFTHKVQITPWMYVQPDIQVIFHPGGTDNVRNALVIGSRFGWSF